MALDAHRRREVSAGELANMLEMAEAGRWWALGRIEEAYGLDLFGYHPEVSERGRL